VSFRECSAGVALEVVLEFGGPLSITEGDGDLHAPRAILGGVSDFSGVVSAEAILQIIGQADVMTHWVEFADEEVDVGEFSHQRWRLRLLP